MSFRIRRQTVEGQHLGYLKIDRAGIVTLAPAGKASRWPSQSMAEAEAETQKAPRGSVHVVEEAHAGRPRTGVPSAERVRKHRERGIGKEAISTALFAEFSAAPTSRNTIASLLERVIDRVHMRRLQTTHDALKQDTKALIMKALRN